jgi:alcohol dehydrogenase class IV
MALPHVNWTFPTRIWFGDGRLTDLPAACRSLGIRRPLLVADRGIAELDFVQHAKALLAEAGLGEAFYGEVDGNPTGRHVDGGVAEYLEKQCDGVIGLGGGSAMDTAKSIGLIAKQTLPLWSFEDVGDNWKQADKRLIAPIIAIPTTAGTGSEVGRAAVILDAATRSKKIIFHPAMLPGLVISDPALSCKLPPSLTAWTGIDALVHAIEAFFAPGYHPMADGIALEAVRLIAQWLPVAVARGDDLEARGHMLVAATMGATAFQKGLGSIHSISHVLGGLYGIHHGLSNAVVLPYGLLQNASHLDDKLARLCRVLEIDGGDAKDLCNFLIEFRHELNIPHTLAELGIGLADAREIGLRALQDPSTATNAAPVDAADLEALFRAAVTGDTDHL